MMIPSLLSNKEKQHDHRNKMKIRIHILNEGGVVRAGSCLEGTAVLACYARTTTVEEGNETNYGTMIGNMGGPLKLYVTGREWVKVSRLQAKRKKEAERVFLSLGAVQLEDFTGKTLHPGSVYSFPFQIPLSDSLPSSTKFSNVTKDVHMKIEYKVMVAGCYATQEQSFIVASTPLPDEQVPCMIPPVIQQLKTVTGYGQGPLAFAASVQDTHIGRGEPLQVNLSTKNDSMVDIQKIELKIVQVISTKNASASAAEVIDGEEEQNEADSAFLTEENFHNMKSLSFKHDLLVQSIVESDGLLAKKHSREHADQATFHRSPDEEEQLLNEIFEELLTNAHPYTLLCPDSARDSYSGRLIHIQHYLKIKLITDALTENPSIKIPLKIGYPPTASMRQATEELRLWQQQQQQQQQQEYLAIESESAWREPYERQQQEFLAIEPESAWRDSYETALPQPERLALMAPPSPRVVETSATMVPYVPHAQDTEDEDDCVPVASALVLPAEAVEASMTSVSRDLIFLGGDVVDLTMDQDTNQVPTASGTNSRANNDNHDNINPYSLSQLYEEMLICVEDLDIIRTKLQDPSWKYVLERLTAEELGTIVALVNLDFDQPRVASTLAAVIGERFTCAHCAAAIENTSDWNRMAMVERLVPYCVDLVEGQHWIRAKLTEWELVVLERILHPDGT